MRSGPTPEARNQAIPGVLAQVQVHFPHPNDILSLEVVILMIHIVILTTVILTQVRISYGLQILTFVRMTTGVVRMTVVGIHPRIESSSSVKTRSTALAESRIDSGRDAPGIGMT